MGNGKLSSKRCKTQSVTFAPPLTQRSELRRCWWPRAPPRVVHACCGESIRHGSATLLSVTHRHQNVRTLVPSHWSGSGWPATSPILFKVGTMVGIHMKNGSPKFGKYRDGGRRVTRCATRGTRLPFELWVHDSIANDVYTSAPTPTLPIGACREFSAYNIANHREDCPSKYCSHSI